MSVASRPVTAKPRYADMHLVPGPTHRQGAGAFDPDEGLAQIRRSP